MNLISNFRDITPDRIMYILTSAEIQQELLMVKLGFLVVTIIMGVFTMFAISRTHYMQWLFTQSAVEFLTQRPYGAKRITKVWNKIKQHLENGSEIEYKLAIIEADNMLESTLKRMGYGGVTLEERLTKLTSATLPNIEEIYQAHQARNNIVRDPSFVLGLDDAKKTIGIYERAFRDLQILD
ncbi:MAG: hypothetical protein HYT21_00975 [Candidatus Nealsonbacteria bacterium]|nr:hypothetical protein [Candidatus Nealsonbacteria bacterium]